MTALRPARFRLEMPKWFRKAVRFAPPALLAAWGVRMYLAAGSWAITSFGPIESHLAAYRQAFIADGWVGLSLAALWLVVWRLVPAKNRQKTKRKPPAPARDF